MKKLIIFGIIALTFATGLQAWNIFYRSSVFLSTSSPNKTYSVELTGNKSSPRHPFIDHQANFNLFKNGQPLVTNGYVKMYDWFDSGFDELYPKHKWENESVLRFSSNLSKSEKSLDSLTVLNKTNKTIKYLKITASDMIFIFEVPSNSRNKISVPYLGDLTWVAGEGEFADGQKIKWNGVNFLNKEKLKEPLRYCLSISDEGLKIESPLMDGYNGGGTSKKPNILKAVNCDL